MTHKTCGKCKLHKPVTEFTVKRAGKDGLSPVCKPCKRQWAIENAESQKANARARYAADPEKARMIRRTWYANNSEQKNEANRLWKLENPGKVAASNHAYRTANAVDRALAFHAYKAANPEKVIAKDRAYRKSYPDKLAATAAKRRAVKLQATPPWASDAKIAEFYFAANFLGMVTGEWHHVDHITPLQSKIVCGLHCEFNLQVLRDCENRTKSNRHWPDMP